MRIWPAGRTVLPGYEGRPDPEPILKAHLARRLGAELIDILWQTLDGTVYTMGTVSLTLFITGITNEMGLL